MEIPDPDDPIFENHDSNFDISQRLDTLSSYSEIYQRRMEKGIPREKLIDKDAVRRVANENYLGAADVDNIIRRYYWS